MIIKENSGYIAITSAVFISVILMVLIFSISYAGFLNRSNILGTYSKKASRAAAEACVSEARLKLFQNALYAGNETIAVGQDQCSILAIEDTVPGVSKTIKTKSTVNMAVTNLKVTVAVSGIVITSWEEVANF